jgi:uncharacterized oxidoreductase
MNITGNTILVTGGGSGIGQALAESLQAKGNKIIIAGNIESQLVETVKKNPAMDWLILDQSTKEGVASLVDQILLKHPDLNVIFNNAGVQFREDLTKGELGNAEMTVATNLLGPIRLIAGLLPSFLKKPQSAIVNVSSAMGFVPLATVPTYGATKAALHSYTQSLRFQLRDTTVQIIEIVPPWVQTALQREQGHNPKAMPLKDFIAETMRLIEDAPDADEIVVDRAAPWRFSEQRGDFDLRFKFYNEGVATGTDGMHP